MSEDPRFCFRSQQPEQTQRAARVLAGVLLPGSRFVLNLCGDLGTGKTQFVKGLAAGLGLDSDQVTSPTFSIVNEYPSVAGSALIHMDFYRLESEIALEEVGFLDLLAMEAVLAIEWGDRFVTALPADRLELQIERPAASSGSSEEKSPREFCATAMGPESRNVLRAWRARLVAGAVVERMPPAGMPTRVDGGR